MNAKQKIAKTFNMCNCICVQGPALGYWGGRRHALRGRGVRDVSRGYTSRGWCTLVWVETQGAAETFKRFQDRGLTVWWA